MRKTRQKEAILRVLRGTTSHPTAGWVYQQVRQEIPNISLGTVYRNLSLLQREGKITELDLAGTMSRFDGNTEQHYHFRCEQCDRVFDVDVAPDKELDDKIARKTGFRVTNHYLEFRGLCPQCQAC
jgi:Fur family peroxide stress response transcriptional regulator